MWHPLHSSGVLHRRGVCLISPGSPTSTLNGRAYSGVVQSTEEEARACWIDYKIDEKSPNT